MTKASKFLGIALLAGLLAAAGLARAANLPPTTKEGSQVVTYAQLGEIVKKYRGKVLVIDFWNIY